MISLQEKILNFISLEKKADKEVIEKIKEQCHNFEELKKFLISSHILTEEEILMIIAREYKIPFFDLSRYKINPQQREYLPKSLALKYKIVPLFFMENVLVVATSNPLDILAVDDIRVASNYKRINFVLCKEQAIMEVLNKLYSESEEVSSLLSEEKDTVSLEEKENFTEVSLDDISSSIRRIGQSPQEEDTSAIVKLVNLILTEALNKSASDIHIEPAQDNLIVRYRIDGMLRESLCISRKVHKSIVWRIKVMADLNLTETRFPQDGRFKIRFDNREIDFRVSTLPTDFGEKVVLRVLDKQKLCTLEGLGFSKKSHQLFEYALCSPFGIILITGPTGSGKSTTLYSILNRANTPDKNIITIEDPVEYKIDGITQIQINPSIGLTFSSCLRAVLRQSPDIIMLGEIRDSETADIAIKASLTGEMIFSTLHTNNAVGAISRLADMGIEPFLVASSLVCATAQRLVRLLCPECKKRAEIKKETLKKIGFLNTQKDIFSAQGCDNCQGTGYKGRSALLEVLIIDDTVREMIIKRAQEDEIINYARENNKFVSLKEDGFAKVEEGLTSLEEVLRVAG